MLNFNFKPNMFGWLFIVSFGLICHFFSKSLIIQLFDLLNYYDYDLFKINLVIFPLSFLFAYFVLKINLTKNYG